MYEVAFVILEMLIGVLPSWFSRKRRLKTHWSALRAEMTLCQEKAKTVLSKDPAYLSPLYRLPLLSFQVSLPVLLADGALSESESLIVSRFYSLAQDINRGLDNAAEMHKADKNEKLVKEYDRNCLKSESLINPKDGQPSLYDQAISIVNQKIDQKWWKYAKHA